MTTPKQPNIIFCFTDQQKATSLDTYQQDCSAIRAANFERITQAGTLFEAAYCAYPLCLPSRIATMTGRYPSASGYIGNGPWLDPEAPCLQTQLKAQGYMNYLAGKDHCFAHPHKSTCENDPGLTARYDRTFLALHNDVQPKEVEEALPHLLEYFAKTPEIHTIWGATEAPWDSDKTLTTKLTDVALGFMEDHLEEHPDKPFFLHWGPPDPHEYYQAPRDVAERFPIEDIKLPPSLGCDLSDRAQFVQYMHWYFNHGERPPSEADYKQLLRIYLAMCQHVDDQLGRILDFVQERGLWENTIFVFSSDHGDMAGEMALAHKWNGLYDGMIRVPLAIAAPGNPDLLAGQRCDAPVNLVDLAATLCEFAGTEAPKGNQGASLVPLMDGTGSREYAFLESGLAGRGMTMGDVKNFPDHDWSRPTSDCAPYDPPHRWTGRCLGVRDKRYKLITREGQSDELYDLISDPWETRNLIGESELKETVLRLKQALFEHTATLQSNNLKAWGDKHMDPNYTPGQSEVWHRPIHKPWQPANNVS